MSDWRTLYPFRSRWLDIDGHRYHYVDEGSGEPLLFVHGNPCWSFHWRELIRALRGQHRAIAPDHLGCGLSDKPQNWPYRLSNHIENLERLIEALELRNITLVAQDWGGAIGLGAAVRSPDRFARIVLFNTGAFRADRMPWRIRVCRTPVLGTLALRGVNAFLRAAMRMTMTHRDRLTPAVRSGLFAPYGSWHNRIAIDRFVHDIPMGAGHPSYDTLVAVEQGLPALAHLPVLLIWGMLDWCFSPDYLERFRSFFPRAEVHRFEDAGHWVVEDAHERIVPLMRDFLLHRAMPGAAAAASPIASGEVR